MTCSGDYSDCQPKAHRLTRIIFRQFQQGGLGPARVSSYRTGLSYAWTITEKFIKDWCRTVRGWLKEHNP